MDRMTTDNEKHGLFFLNTFYGKDGQVWVRGGGPAPGYEDCTLVDFLSRAATPLGISLDEEDPETVGEIMYDNLQFGPMESDGVLGFLWLAAVQAAEMRGLLKMVEDVLGDDYDLDRLREIVQADRDGRCFIATVNVGDYIFFQYDDEIVKCRVQGISLPAHGKYTILHLRGYPVYMYSDRENIDWWKTREAAEAAMKGKQNEV